MGNFYQGRNCQSAATSSAKRKLRMATPFDVTAKDEAAGGKSYQPNQRTNSWRVRSYHMNFQKIATDNA
jgi:hypothetical protein